MQAEPNFSWIQGFVIPALFTFFGAALGFFASQIRDDRKAKQAKESFVQAIGMELDALGNQLDSSLDEVKDSAARVARGGNGPHYSVTLRTSVYTSQLGKLRDVADSLIIEIIHYYSDLSTLQRIFDSVNDFSSEFNRAIIPSGDKDSARLRLTSGLLVLQEYITGSGNRLRGLRKKLPPAPK